MGNVRIANNLSLQKKNWKTRNFLALEIALCLEFTHALIINSLAAYDYGIGNAKAQKSIRCKKLQICINLRNFYKYGL